MAGLWRAGQRPKPVGVAQPCASNPEVGVHPWQRGLRAEASG